MSWEAIKWAQAQRQLSCPQRCVLYVLAIYADDIGSAWPSIATLSTETGLCPKAVSNALNALCNAGVISRSPGDRRSMTYQLTIVPRTMRRLPDTNHLVPDTDRIVPDTNHLVPDTDRIVPDTNHLVPDTIPSGQGTIVPRTMGIVPRSTHIVPRSTDHSTTYIQNNNDTTRHNNDTTDILASSDKSLSAGSDEKAASKAPAKKTTLPVELSEFSLPVIGDESEWRVPKQLLEEWQRSYPAVDVPGELLKMRGWLVSNTQRRKTKRGITRFCNSWLSKAQDKGSSLGRNQFYPGQPACPTEHQLRMQEERLMAEALYAKRVANGETWEQRHANDAAEQPKALEECEDLYEVMENIKRRKRDQACQ